MGFSQIIASFLFLLLMKWSIWYVNCLQHEHQQILQALDTLLFKVSVTRDIRQLFTTFFVKQFAYDQQNILYHGIALVDINTDKWRLFYIKHQPLSGEKKDAKQMHIEHCESWLIGEVLIYNAQEGQKNTALDCDKDILILQLPLHFKEKQLYILPINYKTYVFRRKDRIYQVFLGHQDRKHVLDLKNKPILSMSSSQNIQLQLGLKQWWIVKSEESSVL